MRPEPCTALNDGVQPPEAFDEYQGDVEELLETTVDLSQLDNVASEVMIDPRFLGAFRYLAAPPISEDDLKVLADVSSLARGQLRKKPEDVQGLLEIVRLVLDPRRFSWVVEGREPTEAERSAAIMASAALMAVSRVQTKRRTLGKEQQEAFVKQVLTDAKMRTTMRTISALQCYTGRLGFMLALMLAMGWGSLASVAVAQPWTTAGSAGGMVDDADTKIYDTVGGYVQVKSTATLPETLDIRYTITPVDGLFTSADNILLTVRYRDNGDGGRVVVRIREYNLSTGVSAVKLKFDSDQFQPSGAFQTQGVATLCFSGSFFDFVNNAYSAEVSITKSDATGTPALVIIQVDGGACSDPCVITCG